MDNTNQPSPLTFVHKYELMNHPQKGMDAVKILSKDGQPCRCHKVPFSLVPTAFEGQYAREYETCQTSCTRALLAVQDEKLYFIQTCEANNQKFLIENANADMEAPKEPSKLIL
jgi:hypothetical protein